MYEFDPPKMIQFSDLEQVHSLTIVPLRMKRYPMVEMQLLAWWYRGHIRE